MLQSNPTEPSDARRLAAVDLGSNSFRLLIADALPGSVGDQLRIVDELKETVRIGDGLDRDRMLSSQAQRRALDSLALFGERLRGFDPASVRAVATNTFRVARNADQFLQLASARLGFPIDVVAGREEARLIYLGAAHALPFDRRNRLVVDIGGGSTESIAGRGYETLRRESFQMGCVSLTREFMPDGRFSKSTLRKARIHCGEQIASQVRAFRRIGWEYAIGTSGTAKSLCQVAAQHFGSPVLTADVLARIEAAALQAGNATALRFNGLKPDRAPVFVGGLIVMQALIEEFGIDSIRYCPAALREGVLYDLIGRRAGADRREITVSHLIERYRLDPVHGTQVADLAVELLLAYTGGAVSTDAVDLLRWAARTREVGASIAHDDHHKHGAYMTAHADLPGFSPTEQRRLSWLLLGQTGGLRKLVAAEPTVEDWQCLLCLRLAVILQRRRDGRTTPLLLRAAKGDARRGWIAELPEAWVHAHPLTNRSLETERDEWRSAGIFRHNDYRVVPGAAKESRSMAEVSGSVP